MQLADEPLGVGQHGVDLLDELVWRQASVRDSEIHGAAGGDDSHTELPCGLNLGLDQPLAAAREHIVVVEDGRASRERELREASSRCRVLGLGVDSGPHRVELAEP